MNFRPLVAWAPDIHLLPVTGGDPTEFIRLLINRFAETLDFARQLCTAAVPSLKDSRAPTVLAILSTLTVLSIVAVSARLVARRLSKVALWWDDYTIIVALVRTPGERDPGITPRLTTDRYSPLA